MNSNSRKTTYMPSNRQALPSLGACFDIFNFVIKNKTWPPYADHVHYVI